MCFLGANKLLVGRLERLNKLGYCTARNKLKKKKKKKNAKEKMSVYESLYCNAAIL